MSKYTTLRALSRGVRLTFQHLFNLPSHIATTLNTAANLIQQDQLQEGRGVTKLVLNVPVIDGHYVNRSAVSSSGPVSYDYSIPFCMPAMQDEYNASGNTSDTSPSMVLTEVQLSFDQRGEPASIVDALFNDGSVGNEGLLDYDQLEAYDLKLSIAEKRQTVTAGAAAGTVPTREVFSATLPEVGFSGRELRLNPWVVDGLSINIDPYRSYLVTLKVDSLDLENITGVTRNSHALVSLTVALTFRRELVASDRIDGAAEVQNVPSDHDGDPDVDASTLTLSVPAGNSPLEADTADGLQTNYKLIDNLYGNRFRGGFTTDGDRPGYSHLQQDSSYTVIAVPMFGNLSDDRAVIATAGSVAELPYTAAGSANPTGDRRLIALDRPFVVHHVIAAVNYQYPTTGLMPTGANFQTTIGVGLVTGLRADEYEYQQVAYVQYTPATKSTYRVDSIKTRQGGFMNADTADFELIGVPLVVQGGNSGTGPVTQGRPFWCSKSTSRLAARRNAGIVGGGDVAPTTLGCEQMLEVRWTMDDSTPGLDTGAGSVNEVFVGYGGHWVYIFGKSGLAGPNDLEV